VLAGTFVLVAGGALAAAEWLRPSIYLSKRGAPIDLRAQIPKAFGEWHEIEGVAPLLPDPEMQERLDALYTQVLARTYVNRQGDFVMLSVAYGSDQSSEATAVHRPEFCYSAQGFKVQTRGTAQLPLAGQKLLDVQRLLAQQGGRLEPVMYWVTLDTQATLPGLGRKLAQFQYGLKGLVADGMLVRVSTVRGGSEESQYALQTEFLQALHTALAPSVRPRYFGS
jgi:EpsI family protein